MPRPRGSSYISHQKIYARLLKGPIWIGDWASTGIKSRSTVHQRLKHLKVLRLVTERREGHKILYELCPLQSSTGAFTREGIWWHSLLYPTTRKEKRQARRRYLEALKELRKLEKKSYDINKTFIRILEEQAKTLNSPQGKEVCKILKSIGIDTSKIPIFKLVDFLVIPNLRGTLCLSCLRQRRITYLTYDNETGEITCPYEGIVVGTYFEGDSKIALPRVKWVSDYERKTVDIECLNCHHRNHVPAKRVLVENTSEFGLKTVTPMGEILETAKCKKCEVVIGKPKELLRF